MPTILKLKNSVTTTAAPTTLVQGEAAVNITDKKVWVGNAASSPVQILGAGATVSGTTLTMTGDGTFSGTGQLKVPAGTTGQRSGSPAAGMIRYNSTTGGFEGYTTAWGSIGGGATGAGGDTVFQENSPTVTTSYTLSTGKNAMSVGPITINSGATVTVPSGARWVVL
jgi:hypothetical protein